MYSWSRSLRSLAPAKLVPICLVKVHFELRLKVFFPCQCCRSSSSWWCRPCFGGLECWRWWWFDPPRRQAGPFVAWPSPRGGVPPFFKRKSGKSPLCRKALSKTTKSKVANKVLYLWQWETPSAIHSGSNSLKKSLIAFKSSLKWSKKAQILSKKDQNGPKMDQESILNGWKTT